MSIIDDLVARNERYAKTFDEGGLDAPPSGKLAVVACMDARLDVCGLLGLASGEAHIIRNAGGVLTDDVLRSLTISQRLLGTREIVLVHHTKCGMQTFRDEDFAAALEKETGEDPPFAFHAFVDVEESVRAAMERLRACPFLVTRDAVRGFVYDVDTGRLSEVV